MQGLYTKEADFQKLPFSNILKEILPDDSLISAEQFFDDSEGDKEYNVYKLTTGSGTYIVKKSEPKESFIYKNFFRGKALPVPWFLGSAVIDENEWAVMEYVGGPDLRHFDESSVLACAESFSKIANAFWDAEGDSNGRYEEYLKRIERRSLCLKNEPELMAAYEIFMERQKTCPRTLCNGDFIPFNGLYSNGKVIIIDWEYGGLLPYSLDVARIIAHGTENSDPFYITPELFELYIERVYELLEQKPDYERYRLDVDLALLNEYVEMLEWGLNDPKERPGFFDHYYTLATDKAKTIIRKQGG